MPPLLRDLLSAGATAMVTAAALVLLIFLPDETLWLVVGLVVWFAGFVLVLQERWRWPGLALGVVGSTFAGIAFGWGIALYDLMAVLRRWLIDPRLVVILSLAVAAVLILLGASGWAAWLRRWRSVVPLLFCAAIAVIFAGIAARELFGPPAAPIPTAPSPLFVGLLTVLFVSAWLIARVRWGSRRPAPQPVRRRKTGE